MRFSCFVEGVRIPCEYAQVTQAPDEPATAMIHLPPSASAFYAPERALVHLFFLDDGPPTVWRRLFEGEIVRKAISYTGGVRNAVYYCQDDTLYWQQAHRQFFQSLTTVDLTRFLTQAPEATTGDIGNDIGQGFATLGSLLWPTREDDALGSIRTRIEEIFRLMVTHNTYYRTADRRRNLLGRLQVLDTHTALSILLTQAAEIRRLLLSPSPGSGYSTSVTLWSLIKLLIDRLYYQLLSNPAPPYLRESQRRDLRAMGWPVGSMAQHVFMPEITFAPPPRCNVFLPPMVEQFNYNDDFLAAPTRTAAVTQAADGGIANRAIYEPAAAGPAVPTLTLTPEEQARGFVPAFFTILPSEYKVPSDSEGDEYEEELHQARRLAVQYRHWRAVYGARTAQGTGPFTPWPVAGLPAAVLDRVFGIVQGDLMRVVHTFTSDRATTAFMLVRCRHASTPSAADYVPPWRKNREVQPPPGLLGGNAAWLDDNYRPENIGRTVYGPVLGYTAAEQYGSVLEGEETAYAALTRLQGTFEALPNDPDRQQYAQRLGRRPIATLAESFFFLGARPRQESALQTLGAIDSTRDDDMHWPAAQQVASPAWGNGAAAVGGRFTHDPPDAGPFLAERQAWAEAYRAETALHIGATP